MRNNRKKVAPWAAPLLVLLGLGMSGEAARAVELELEVRGLTSTEGHLLVAVFADAPGWLRSPVAVRRISAAAALDGRLTMALNDMPEGALALSVIHDLNGNGRLDMNPVGMPVEPFGFSNNASGRFGPPRFEDALIATPAGARVAVQLN